MDKVKVGKGTYGELRIYSFQNNREKLTIGNYCSIAGAVVFILGGEHPYKRLFTFPFSSKVLHAVCGEQTPTKGPIVVEDDVWIGNGSQILSGVTLGKGSIIGAGSIVSKSIPPYAIYAGSKIIKYRFSEKVIEKIMAIDFSNTTIEAMNKYLEYCLIDVTDDNIDDIVSCFKS